ncbi:hypothetical protein P7L78_00215 (plasmid) [Tistrella bauzanensis]|uniref:Spore coat protein U domain-containing protein n=1 Tax=Tistrella arctica TaxID=3133430 RepID=A0ABU9YLN3_9PROT
MMRRHVFGLAIFLAATVAGQTAWATLCKENVYITQLGVGTRDGTDSNSDIAFDLSDGSRMYLDTSYNANDAVGRVLYSQLVTAYTLKVPVNIYDNHGSRCDDVSEVWLMRF